MITTLNDYEVKNVKSIRGREGNGYEVTLYRLGARIGKVVDYGDGAMADFDLLPNFRELVTSELHAIALEMRPEYASLEDLSELAVEALISIYENNKASKNGVVFRKFADSPIELVAKGATREQVRAQFPDSLVWDSASRSWIGA